MHAKLRHISTRFPAWPRAVRFRHIVLEVLVALCLAFLVWLSTRSRDQEDTLDMISVPVSFALAPGTANHYELEVQGAARVPISFTGPPTRIKELRRQLQRGALQIALNLAVPEDRQHDCTYRDLVKVEAADVPVPSGVTAVVTEGRNGIAVTLHRLSERQLPVRLDYLGEDRLSDVQLEPATVLVRGPKEILDSLRSIATQPFVSPSHTTSDAGSERVNRGQLALVSDWEGRRIQATPAGVNYRMRVHPKHKTYELADVPIHFLCPADFTLRPRFADEQPAKLTLQIRGPAAEAPPTVKAFVDLTRGPLGGGRNVEPLRLQLPRDFEMAQDTPRVAFYLEPPARSEE